MNRKKLRNQWGLSQDKLSKLIEISHNLIIKIKSNFLQSASMGSAHKIGIAFGVNINDTME